MSGPGPAPRVEQPPSPAAVPAGGLSGRVICIDPGHAATTDSGTEPIGPGSSQTKVKDPGGTSGIVTGVREPVVTLAISLYMKQLLEAEGATVVMTRSGADFSGGNRERAQIANQAGADLFIRVHADGSSDPARKGVSTLYPASISGWTDDIYVASMTAAAAIQPALASKLGAPDLGTVERSDISGFNWADVPAILVEVGFMSNPEEDRLLNEPVYQQQIAAALLSGIEAYFAG
jgi:N-acetylmuramoyl-L-alanine amidase